MKVGLVLEYDGAEFHGWQYQPGVQTVEGELARALHVYLNSLRKTFGQEPMERPPVVTGSGRTDSGVHARGQVASFAWPDDLPYERGALCQALNGITERSLAIRSAFEREDSFDARRSPHRKRYYYYVSYRVAPPVLERHTSWHVRPALDLEALEEATSLFEGTHDFSSFRAADCSAQTTTRTLFSSKLVQANPELLVFQFEGNGFLKQMIRTMLGTLIEVGRGRREVTDISRLLLTKDRTLAGETAPAKGLLLESVIYLTE